MTTINEKELDSIIRIIENHKEEAYKEGFKEGRNIGKLEGMEMLKEELAKMDIGGKG